MGVACLKFHGENFRGWLKYSEISESFLPRSFPLYGTFCSCTQVRVIVTIHCSDLLFKECSLTLCKQQKDAHATHTGYRLQIRLQKNIGQVKEFAPEAK